MKLAHLLNLRRYRRCRRIFRRPLAAHLRIARAGEEPIDLELIDGAVLQVPNVRRCRGMFDWVLRRSPNPLPVSSGSGAIIFRHGDVRVSLRPDGSDYYIFKEIFLEDIYGIDRTAGPLGTVIDLGGNIGLFTLKAAFRAERVICVEPVPANLELAKLNARLNGLEEKAVFRRNAVTGGSDEMARIFLSSEACAHSIRRQHTDAWETVGCEDVPTISIPDLFERERVERCSLLKCDIEGAEFEAFRQTPRDVLGRIDRIAMEVHFTADGWDADAFGGLDEKLKSAGFDVDCEPLRDEEGKQKQVVLLSAMRA
ncbi:MAG: FkbM family methyltransferase [Pirellulales bacterium]|nr:FkbM family methyltransferase [Pirellulales bacterium]